MVGYLNEHETVGNSNQNYNANHCTHFDNRLSFSLNGSMNSKLLLVAVIVNQKGKKIHERKLNGIENISLPSTTI